MTSIPWLPEEDGHPSISRDGKYLVTDTYPGRSRTSKLLIYDWTEQKVVQKLRIPQPIESNPEQRCDLHPKWLGTDTVVFESCHSGIRQLYTFRIMKVAFLSLIQYGYSAGHTELTRELASTGVDVYFFRLILMRGKMNQTSNKLILRPGGL